MTRAKALIMWFAHRRLAFALLLAAFAFGASGCNSNAKIVGKWKVTGGGGIPDAAVKDMEASKSVVYLEFKADGTGAVGFESADPAMQKKVAESKKKGGTFNYKVSGDTIELADISKDLLDDGPFGKKDPAKGTIKFEGDNLTLTIDDAKDKALKLTKMK